MNRDDIIRRRFASNLEEVMHAKDLNQSELARQCGVQQSDVSGWLGRGELEGRAVLPRSRVLVRICEVLNVSADWLLLGRGSRNGGLPTVQESFYEGWRWCLQEVRAAIAGVEARGRGKRAVSPRPEEAQVAADLARKHRTVANTPEVRRRRRKPA